MFLVRDVSEEHLPAELKWTWRKFDTNESSITIKDIIVGPLPKQQIIHIAFLKVHKAASSTVQNILYRYGVNRNLSFVLPYQSHYISQYANIYNLILPPYDNSTKKYDILCNHAIFNFTKFSELMYDDAFYFAIVREPLDLFISAALYYRYVWPTFYLTNLSSETFIHDLIVDPWQYEHIPIMSSRTFNYMAKDFGFKMDSIEDVMGVSDAIVASFISKLLQKFRFVMIVEFFDESLVMLKRYLNWSTKDILYIKNNEFSPRSNRGKKVLQFPITDEDKAVFRKRNRIDYAIYDAFMKEFLDRKKEQNDLDEEVEEFKTILKEVTAFCNTTLLNVDKIFPQTDWHSEFSLNADDCRWMSTNELPFWRHLVQQHNLHLQSISV